jgi:hypothetical protein
MFYKILSDKKIVFLALTNMFRLSSSVRITLISCYWNFFLFHYIQVLCQYRLWKLNHAYLTYLMLQRQLSHLNGRKLHHQVSSYYIVCVWLRLVLYREHDIVWLLLVACTMLLCNCTNTESWKPFVDRGPVYTLENFQWCPKSCFIGAAILRGGCLPLILRLGNHKSLVINSVSHRRLGYCWRLNAHFWFENRL